MSLNEYNLKALQAVYKNALLAMDSISDILPSVKDEELIKEIKNQFEGYQEIANSISDYMAKNSIEPEKTNPFQKAMMWSSIKMKTMFNGSKNHIAEMMIKGTVMGINELTAMQNESSNLEEEIEGFVNDLLKLEEKYNEQLKKYL